MESDFLKYSDPERMARLCEKSLKATGSKWKWRRICQKKGVSVALVEEQLDKVIEKQNELIKKLKEIQANAKKGAVSGDKRRREYSDTGEVRNRSTKGKEVRPEETDDVTSTTGGPE